MGRRVLIFIVLMMLASTECGSDDSGDGKADAGSSAKGPIVLVDGDGGLRVVDAGGGDARPIEAPTLDSQGRGVTLDAPGLAFFETEDGGLLLLDASSGTAQVIGNLSEHNGSLFKPLELGGGRRFTVFGEEFKIQGLVVDIEARSTRPVTDFISPEELDDSSGVGEVRISPGERHLLVDGYQTQRLVSLSDGLAAAGAGRSIPGGGSAFSADGTAIFADESVPKPGSEDELVSLVRRFPVDGGAEEVVSGAEDIFVGVVGDSALLLDGERRAFLARAAGDRREVDLGLAEEDSVGLSQAMTGQRRLVAITSGDETKRRWMFVDGQQGTVQPLDELDDLVQGEIIGRRFVLLVEPSLGPGHKGGKGSLAVLDIGTGKVRRATFDAGDREILNEPQLSPDGARVGITVRKGDDYFTALVPFSDEQPTELDGSLHAWSPESSALVVARIRSNAPHMFLVGVGGGDGKDLGEAIRALWPPV
jgi:hypothetical protein